MKLSYFFSAFFLTFSLSLFAQNRVDSIHFDFFADIYYATEPSAINEFSSSPLYYNHSNKDEFNLNLTGLTARYKYNKTRINIGLQAGTFVIKNTVSDPGFLKYFHELNVGWLLGKKENWAIDLGLLPSHIGQETVIGFDLPTVTRSLIAENSPYFETGIRVSYTSSSKKFYFAQLVTNGWSNMYVAQLKGTPSFGQQFTFSPYKNLQLNWSNFVGDLSADASYQTFFFQDFSVKYVFKEKWTITGSFDSGSSFRFMVERKPIQGSSLALQYKINKKWTLASRFEKYTDEYGLILTANNLAGRWTNYSLNTDWQLSESVKVRLEAKRLEQNPTSLVDEPKAPTKYFTAFTGALQIKL